jgi:hypothetical protein
MLPRENGAAVSSDGAPSGLGSHKRNNARLPRSPRFGRPGFNRGCHAFALIGTFVTKISVRKTYGKIPHKNNQLWPLGGMTLFSRRGSREKHCAVLHATATPG